ncbi:MAG TPA: hypothetical protein VFA45_02010 [Actinomycetes bacterium]|jgi:hypothetical protein|nr:hypothetical protein [Actinomycetes bacterium]
MLVLEGIVASIRDGAPASVSGAVHIGDDGLIAAVTPLDAEPARATPWASHTEWPRRAATYQARVSDPAELLGKAAGRALLRYVETRAIIGGTTAIQGNPKGTPPPDGDLVRNIDSERLGTHQDFIRVRTLVASKVEDLDPYVTAVGQHHAFIYHLCEGTGPRLLSEYALVDDAGLVHRLLIAIHGTALGRTQLAALAAVGATLVWSRFSNLWLYGGTAAIDQASAAGLRICLGSDWAPSGTKNVLWELKVADLWNRVQPRPVFTAEQRSCRRTHPRVSSPLAPARRRMVPPRGNSHPGRR